MEEKDELSNISHVLEKVHWCLGKLLVCLANKTNNSEPHTHSSYTRKEEALSSVAGNRHALMAKALPEAQM